VDKKRNETRKRTDVLLQTKRNKNNGTPPPEKKTEHKKELQDGRFLPKKNRIKKRCILVSKQNL